MAKAGLLPALFGPKADFAVKLRAVYNAGLTRVLGAGRFVSEGFMAKPRVVVLIPCFNEEAAIDKVVSDFRQALPQATVYVYDNNSTDRTVEVAQAAGAQVRSEPMQGKGNVVRRMFRDIDADYYVMVDGDDTYEATLAPEMVQLAVAGRHDLVNCVRCETESAAYRGGHRLGNQLLTGVVRLIFGDRVEDMLSGYKVFSRRFAKTLPALSQGFDIETELTVHALELAMPVAHVSGPYRGRPAGSASKLRTYRDGWRILMLILKLVRHERPMFFFGAFAGLLMAISLILISPILVEYARTGLVPRFPTAILSMGVMLLGFMSLNSGILLDTVSRGRREVRMLAYLQQPLPEFVAEQTARPGDHA